MNHVPSNSLIAQLNRIKLELDAFANPAVKSALLQNIDEVIAQLLAFRSQLTAVSVEQRASEIDKPLGQVIEFLEYARSEPALGKLLLESLGNNRGKTKRVPIEVPPNLTNEQIRALLEKRLSKKELKEIAAQRGISPGKRNEDALRSEISRTLDRQEGYERLASPRRT